jgi:hypothetical protein
MYIKEGNILFVHIPKTGGTSIVKFLNNRFYPDMPNTQAVPATTKELEELTVGQRAHLTIKKYIDFGIITEKTMLSCNSFAVTRNPMNRAISTFFYLKRLNFIKNSMSFQYFMKTWLPGQVKNPKEDFHHFVVPQYNFISIDGQVVIKKIIRFENLSNDLSNFMKDIGISLTLSKENAGHSGYSKDVQHLKEEKRYQNIIYDLYGVDYELINSLDNKDRIVNDCKTN